MSVECEQVIESGAYVLGILEADERAAYERHLRTCETCQAEVADFSGLPGLLAQLDPEEAAAIGDAASSVPSLDDRTARADRPGVGRPAVSRFESKEPLLRSLPSAPRSNPADEFVRHGGPPAGSRTARGVQRRQRRWRAVTVGLAAAACLALGVLVGAQFLNRAATPTTPSPQPLVAMQPAAADVPIHAQVALTSFIGGTEVRMHCVYDGGHPAPRWTIKLLVYPKDGGDPQQISTWTAAHGDDLTLSATSALSPAQIGRVELRKGDGTRLLDYTPA